MNDEILVLGTPVRQTLASSRDELAAHCGVSVRTIASALAGGNSPGRNANGTYDIAKWRDWFTSRKAEPEEIDDFKRRRQIAMLELEELKVKKKKIEIAEKEGVLVNANELFHKEHKKIKQIYENTVAEIRAAFPSGADELCERIRTIFSY